MTLLQPVLQSVCKAQYAYRAAKSWISCTHWDTSIERGYRLRVPVHDELDPDIVGNLAGEGAGHRG
jgi:hypothetical protein